jgi:hypothetical protein
MSRLKGIGKYLFLTKGKSNTNTNTNKLLNITAFNHAISATPVSILYLFFPYYPPASRYDYKF